MTKEKQQSMQIFTKKSKRLFVALLAVWWWQRWWGWLPSGSLASVPYSFLENRKLKVWFKMLHQNHFGLRLSSKAYWNCRSFQPWDTGNFLIAIIYVWSLADYSPWRCKRVGHSIVTKRQQQNACSQRYSSGQELANCSPRATSG